MRIRPLAVCATIAVLGLAVPAQAQRFDFQGSMTGSEEVPGPGDPDGSGTFKVSVDNATNTVCYELAWQKIDEPTAAHVHVGGPDQAGRVMVDFNLPVNGPKACIPVDSTAVGHMTGGPKSHYVNLHTAAHVDGAVRGQLQR